jgi:3-oxoacyl-[acyl-carrier protein] reductase
MDLGLKDRGALIGGGSAGIGRAIAEALAAEGCRLLLWARNEDRLSEAAASIRERFGTQVESVPGDAAQPGTAVAIARAAEEALGTVDICILNAGGPPTTDAAATDAAGWTRALQLLAVTPVELATHLLPGMRERRWGRVVAVLSSTIRQPIPELVYSNAGRSALALWLKTTAAVVAPDGVTMNGVLPGRLETARVKSLDHARAEREGRTDEEVRDDEVTRIPAGRYGRPEELASLVAFLCSERAGYLTGTFTAVDGGLIRGYP